MDDLWLSDAAWSWNGKQTTLYIWNPLVDLQHIDLTVTTDQTTLPELDLFRILTPHPRVVIVGGMAQDNPNIPPDYSLESLTGVSSGGEIHFRNIPVQYGETTINLVWNSLADSEYPVARIEIDFHP
jgi:hypothetical protein